MHSYLDLLSTSRGNTSHRVRVSTGKDKGAGPETEKLWYFVKIFSFSSPKTPKMNYYKQINNGTKLLIIYEVWELC